MRERRFGRLGWTVSDVGYGMWGIAGGGGGGTGWAAGAVGYGMWGMAGGEGGWTGADGETGDTALDEAVRLGCDFFDTAWIYGRGESERMLGNLVGRHPERR